VRRTDTITETMHNGEDGRNGRPRVKDEVIMPPQYEQIELFDSNEEIRFQGEIAKYKACINPGFMPRWIQVTDSALRYFKGRCNALSCCNRPLMAIPIAAIIEVKRVSFNLQINPKDPKQTAYRDHQLEILLKEDFLDLYLRIDYERVICGTHGGTCSHQNN